MAAPQILLELKKVAKRFGATTVLQDIDLAVSDGEFITILGPSGSGKTTILRLIGGFAAPDSGAIVFEGKNIVDLPINRRPFNTVFQDYALFPHMTVRENVAYGLKVRRVPASEIARRVAATLDLVQLSEFADRYPSQLSGGQKQRVALARAIICQPRLILLDEPLAALDVELRRQMQGFLKSIQREIRTTFLFVTHDQEEAIAMADRICVMNAGRIQQIGSPMDLYYRPRTEFVARFFGDNNLIPGVLGDTVGNANDDRLVKTPFGDFRCALGARDDLARLPTGQSVFVAARPESISLGPASGAVNLLSVSVKSVDFAGAASIVVVTAQGTGGRSIDLRVKLHSKPEGMGMLLGQTLDLAWRPQESAIVLA